MTPPLRIQLLAALLLLPCGASQLAADEAEKPDADFAVQGEYVGELRVDGGAVKIGLQVVALGEGSFDAIAYHGGLPGAGAAGGETFRGHGATEGGVTRLVGDQGCAEIKDGVVHVLGSDGETIGELEKITRESPTLGAKPPAGAVVLFDGASAEAFRGGRLTDDGLLMQGATSKQTFGDCRLHLEFRTPYEPADRGQARGNSGCYLEGRYEVQILDSFGLAGKDNECGGVYSVAAPKINMCLPPLSWQTYDIDYTAARYDEAGEKTTNARITVRHNGVLIHENLELPHATTAAPLKEGPTPGPLFLQNHGDEVRFRNVWLVEGE